MHKAFQRRISLIIPAFGERMMAHEAHRARIF